MSLISTVPGGSGSPFRGGSPTGITSGSPYTSAAQVSNRKAAPSGFGAGMFGAGQGQSPTVPPPEPVLPPIPVPQAPMQGAFAGLQGAGAGAGGDAIGGEYSGLRGDLGYRTKPPAASLAALQQLRVY